MKWTIKEIEILKNNYSSLKKEELLKLIPNRNWDVIKRKSNYMGIKRYYQKINTNYISTFLKENYQFKSYKELSKELNLSISTISNYIKSFQIKKIKTRFYDKKPIRKSPRGWNGRYLHSIEKDVICTYNMTLDIPRTAKLFHIKWDTVKKILFKNHVEIISNSGKYNQGISRKICILMEERKDSIIELYLLKQKTIYNIEEIIGISKTIISRYLKKWGIKLRGSLIHQMYTCDDGHKVRSSYELNVDNWLYHQSIPHATNQSIGSYYYDFKVGEYYIEIWGMIERENYKQQMLKKLEFYNINRLKVISLFPKDDFHQKLGFLIPLFSKEQRNLEQYYEK